MNIVLIGNPNCGKSTLFNALTGAHAKTGNWHGVTVGALTRKAKIGGQEVRITDLPGIYSLNAYSMEERLAAEAVQRGDYDFVVCVADALTLTRSLALLRDLLNGNTPSMLVVTMADLLRKRGGELDERALSKRLGIPVLCVNAHKKSDIARLKGELLAQRSRKKERSDGSAACSIDDIYREGKRTESRAERLFYNRYFALPFFFAVILCVFFLAFAPHMPGRKSTVDGKHFNPNIPTEECFTTPKRGSAEGIVYAVKPLSYGGELIENFWIRFEGGRAVECGAEKNESLLKKILAMDEGASYLGECALVPYESPINQTGILFYNTLFDENACCHLALGRGYSNTIVGFEKYDRAEFAQMGVNDSSVHVDFMIGAEDLEITGITKSGERIAVFEGGTWSRALK